MNNLHDLLFYLSIPLLFIIGLGLIKHFYGLRKNKKFLLRSVGSVLFIVAISALPFWIVAEHGADDFWSKIEWTSVDNGTPQSRGIENDSLDLDDHFYELEAAESQLYAKKSYYNIHVSSFINEPVSLGIISKYTDYTLSPDSTIQDIGHLFLAMHYANLETSSRDVIRELEKMHNTDYKYYDYVRGYGEFLKFSWSSFDASELYLISSIEKGESTENAYSILARLYRVAGEDEKLEQLITSNATNEFVPDYIKREHYYQTLQVSNYWTHIFSREIKSWSFWTVGSALILFGGWLYFLRRLDIYEPEKKSNILLVIVLSALSMQLLYPMHDFLWINMEYYRPLLPFKDFWYMVISIGMVEEFVKILPVLLILRFTKAINEPFDYILYASISGLTFAFIENIGYFDSGLNNISIRGIYCCIGHMVGSATIGYGLMLAKYRGYNKFVMFGIFFLIAAMLHGLYDFLIMDWLAHEYSWMTGLIVIFEIHIWVLFVNNTLNISNFYNEKIELHADRIKLNLIAISVLVLMTGYVAMGLNFGSSTADAYLEHNYYFLIFYMAFIVLSMGSMKIVRGYISPISFPFRSLFPLSKKMVNQQGIQIQLIPSKKYTIEEEFLKNKGQLSQTAELKRQVFLDDQMNSYLIELEKTLDVDGYDANHLIAIPQWDHHNFNMKKRVVIKLYAIENIEVLNQPILSQSDFKFVGRVFCQKKTSLQTETVLG